MRTETMTQNILSTLDQATPEELEHGLSWYATAHTYAAGLAAEFDSDDSSIAVERAAGVIAAISPRLSWDLNMTYAYRIYAFNDAPLLGLSKSKALRILGGEAPDDVFHAPNGAPNSGQKVRAFFACIANPEHSDEVCVDRHAYDVAIGTVGDDKSRHALDRNGTYSSIADAYRSAARRRGLKAHQIQAITWVTWKRLKSERTSVHERQPWDD